MQTDTSDDAANGDSRTKVWSFRAFGKLMQDRTILVLVIAFVAGMAGHLWQVYRMQSNLVDTFALQEASLYSGAIGQFRSLYTSEVVKRAKAYGMEITHDYETKEGAIPLPATLSMALGNRIAESEFGGKTKLYSQYPFPWRGETGGLTDQFSKDAWQYLTQEPDKPYYRFESDEGTPSLRYATADVMQVSCVTYRNTHPETPKNDWRVGDVRGVLEVDIPMDVAIAETKSGLRGTFALMAGMDFFGLTALVTVIGKLRRTTAELEQRVARRTGSLGESEARVRAIVDGSADGIITIDETGFIQSFNGAAESTFGYLESEIVGEKINILMPSPYREEHDAFLQRDLGTGVKTILSERREVTGCRKDGTVFPMDLTASESRVGDRRMFTDIVRDITKRKWAEGELWRSRHEIEEANTHLTESVRELETFNTLAVGRELRMIELKEEINALLAKHGKTPRYEIVQDEVMA